MKKIIPLIIIIIFGLLQIRTIIPQVWYSSHDGMFHVIRAEKYFQELSLGQFPVRWTGDLDEGYGLPLFNYIYPTPYLFSSIFQLFGISASASVKSVLILFYLIGLLGYYFLFKKRNQKLAILSAFIFGLTPYIFVDIFVRCAFGELVAICLMPWVIYGLENKKRFFITVSLAIILTSHNFIGPIFLAFLLLYLLIHRQFNRLNISSLILAIGLSSFFLIPMIFERNYISSGNQNNFTFDYREHFVYPLQLIYGKWDYWYSVAGPLDGMSFQVGIANILSVLIGVVIFLRTKPTFVSGFYLALYFFLIFLMLPFSKFIWLLFPPLQVIQFPWRFLVFTTFLSPFIYFEALIKFKKKTFLIGLIIVFIAMYNVRNYRRPMLLSDSIKYQQEYSLLYKKTTTTIRQEISPRWSPDQKFKTDDFLVKDKVISLFQNSIKIDFIQTSNSIENITILRNYFPGWQLKSLDNQQKYDIKPDSTGNILVSLPPGKYRLFYGGTIIQKSANYLSLLSLIAWVLLLLRSKKNYD